MRTQLLLLDEEDDDLPLRRRPSLILPAGIHKESAGTWGLQVAVTRESAGAYSVLAAPGWNVYVGVDALPDLTASPVFTATLPYQIATSPPVSGTTTYNVLVRKVNEYGLESQNQQSYSFTVDSSGSLVTVPPTPIMLRALVSGTGLRIMAMHPRFQKAVPSQWRLWVKATAPDVGVDAVTQTATADSPVLRPIQTGTFAAGTWHVALAIYEGGTLSEPARTTVQIPAALAPPLVLP